ncbi:hypothetical protein NIES4071_67520 [Calothrix sp. NIES-4071]|nr:hypothetical protein NIES4071_67520 [Calothrix sp. NIES-4071]BAZ61030.1 hypothetical protein NIES4105_67480 [Calothrix sp. NIES-4105]
MRIDLYYPLRSKNISFGKENHSRQQGSLVIMIIIVCFRLTEVQAGAISYIAYL